MDFKEIKNFRPSNGEKYIFVENGKPIMVLLSFEDYKGMSQSPERQSHLFQVAEAEGRAEETEGEPVEEIQPVEELKQELRQELKKELTLEDLPF